MGRRRLDSRILWRVSIRALCSSQYRARGDKKSDKRESDYVRLYDDGSRLDWEVEACDLIHRLVNGDRDCVAKGSRN